MGLTEAHPNNSYVSSLALGSSLYRGLTSVDVNALRPTTVLSSDIADVSPPSLYLCQSSVVPYSDAPTALCDNISGDHQVQTSCQYVNKYTKAYK